MSAVRARRTLSTVKAGRPCAGDDDHVIQGQLLATHTIDHDNVCAGASGIEHFDLKEPEHRAQSGAAQEVGAREGAHNRVGEIAVSNNAGPTPFC
jgi:hypothetical protein